MLPLRDWAFGVGVAEEREWVGVFVLKLWATVLRCVAVAVHQTQWWLLELLALLRTAVA